MTDPTPQDYPAAMSPELLKSRETAILALLDDTKPDGSNIHKQMILQQVVALVDQDRGGSVYNVPILAPELLDASGVNGWKSFVDQDGSKVIDDEEASAALAAAFMVAAKHHVRVADAPVEEIMALMPNVLQDIRKSNRGEDCGCKL